MHDNNVCGKNLIINLNSPSCSLSCLVVFAPSCTITTIHGKELVRLGSRRTVIRALCITSAETLSRASGSLGVLPRPNHFGAPGLEPLRLLQLGNVPTVQPHYGLPHRRGFVRSPGILSGAETAVEVGARQLILGREFLCPVGRVARGAGVVEREDGPGGGERTAQRAAPGEVGEGVPADGLVDCAVAHLVWDSLGGV